MIKQLLLVVLIVAVVSEDICTAKRFSECETDVEKAFTQCEKAAKEKGADQTADINCLKYLLSSRKDCWVCICEIAKKGGFKVRGCDILEELFKNIQTFNLRT